MTVRVWATANRKVRFHSGPDCPAARRGGRLGELVEQNLDELRAPVPCRVCYPDAPRLRVRHKLCHECQQSRPLPCPHNGAVQAYVPRRGNFTHQFGGEYDPDSVTMLVKWVWPENAHHYTLVNA